MTGLTSDVSVPPGPTYVVVIVVPLLSLWLLGINQCSQSLATLKGNHNVGLGCNELKKNLWWKVDLHDVLGIAMFTLSSCMNSACIPCGLSQYHVSWYMLSPSVTRACFLSLAQCKLRLCSANHRAGYFSNLACDWLSIVWAYSEQETENRPWAAAAMVSALFYRLSRSCLWCVWIPTTYDFLVLRS